MDINILMALAKELNVTLDFFSGGPLNVDDVDVETFVSRYRQLDAHGKKVVQSLITLELERIEEEKAE